MKEHYRDLFQLIKEYSKPNRFYYWADLILTGVFAYTLILLMLQTPFESPLKFFYFLSGSFFINKGIYFMHEVFHQGKTLKGYGFLQNLLFGFVFKYPNYTHFPHHFHHNAGTYGTKDDPEYEGSWIQAPFTQYLMLLPISILWPFLQFIRFGILPIFLPLIGRVGRMKVFTHASTFAMDLKFQRPLRTKDELNTMYFQDSMCFVVNLILICLVYLEKLSIANFLLLQCFSSVFFLFNFMRALASHSYKSDGKKMTLEEQLIDSISIPSSKFNFFWAPVGLNYHSLHHYFPTIPYHNLSKVHQVVSNIDYKAYETSLRSSLIDALSKNIRPENDSKYSLSSVK